MSELGRDIRDLFHEHQKTNDLLAKLYYGSQINEANKTPDRTVLSTVVLGTVGQLVCGSDRLRHELLIVNVGAASAYLYASHENIDSVPVLAGVVNAFVLPSGDSIRMRFGGPLYANSTSTTLSIMQTLFTLKPTSKALEAPVSLTSKDHMEGFEWPTS